jgi:hypothetical protein
MPGGGSPRKAWVAYLGCTAAVAGLALSVFSSLAAGSRALTHPGTIRITDREIKRTKVDVGAKGHSAGDLDVGRYLLYNKGITPKPIGHSELLCTATGNRTSSCSGTFFLPKGRIVATGIIAQRLIYELAVVGGTGLYGNVRGTLTVTSLGMNPARELLVFRLVV